MRAHTRSLLFLGLGFVICLVLGELTPVCTLGFWRLAYAKQFVMVCGPGDAHAPITEAKLFLRVSGLPKAEESFLLLYKVGNPQGRAFALFGLHELHSPSLDEKLDDFAKSGGMVQFRSTLCLSEQTPAASIAHLIRHLDTLVRDARAENNATQAQDGQPRTGDCPP